MFLLQKGVSFDWWTHIGAESSRYRSTILSGSVHQLYSRNLFDNPLNDFELVTTQHESPQFDISSINARYNYWGPPGTIGTAAGKIRDQHDDPLLIRVDYDHVLESNTSLIEGDCPAGWFLVGREEFKSCFIFIGAASTYSDAVQTCQYLDAFLPIMQSGDPRQKELAAKIDILSQLYITELERINSFGFAYDIPIWIASLTIPSNQCGWMSSRTASIGEQNCHNLLPYVCERGTGPYQEPLLWRADFLLVSISIILFFIGIFLLIICAFCKSNTKDRQFTRRKQFVRDSIRSNQQLIQMRQQQLQQKPMEGNESFSESFESPSSNSSNNSGHYYGECCSNKEGNAGESSYYAQLPEDDQQINECCFPSLDTNTLTTTPTFASSTQCSNSSPFTSSTNSEKYFDCLNNSTNNPSTFKNPKKCRNKNFSSNSTLKMEKNNKQNYLSIEVNKLTTNNLTKRERNKRRKENYNIPSINEEEYINIRIRPSLFPKNKNINRRDEFTRETSM
uniref:Uncharacterized protein n=1 Tax=Meloidogyne enterolobii TaxID=390850 RepID=A0A6V7VIX2_MELEN|nr:unnamed protein product [Meloidogyne enterolobii]